MRKNLSIAVCIFSLSLIALFNFSCISARKEKGAVGSTTNLGVKTSEVSEEKTTDTKPTSDSSKEEIKEIEEKAAETKEDLKEKGEAVKAAQKEAEKSIKEKESIEKKVQSKEQAAIIAREKLEALKKEAEVTKKPEVLKETKQLAKEAEKLEKEADVHREKLKTAESKAGFAQKKVDVQQATVDALKKELEDLKKARAAKRSFLEKTLASVTIIFIGLILLFLMKLGLKNFGRLITKKDVLREDALTLRMKTISKLFNWLGGFIIIGIVVYMVLETHGISVGPLLAGAGIIGLAFGFGGQYLIRDLINGLFILVEGQYRIGDVVKIGEYGGLVEDINLRITTLRDLEGRVIVIPNGEIKIVVNYTRKYAQALLNIGVAYKENVDRVMGVIKEIGKEMRKDEYFGKLILDDVEMFGVDDFGDSQVTIKFRIKTLPIKQWEVMREFRRRLKNRFDELGIEIPFPHTTIYWGTGKENDWIKNFADQITSKKTK